MRARLLCLRVPASIGKTRALVIEMKDAAPSLSELSDLSGADVIQNTLLGGSVLLKQPLHGYRASIDTVLLAAAVPSVKAGEPVLELGTGSGGALLCYMARVQEAVGTGLEISTWAVELARQNLQDNGFEDRGEIVEGDVQAIRSRLSPGAYAQVFANPPFHAPGSTQSPNPEKARAKLAHPETLTSWIGAAIWALRPKGGLTLIHRADHVDSILAALHGKAGAIEVIPIRARVGSPASRVIIRARKGLKSPAQILPDLTLHPEIGDQKYTEAAELLLNGPTPFF